MNDVDAGVAIRRVLFEAAIVIPLDQVGDFYAFAREKAIERARSLGPQTTDELSTLFRALAQEWLMSDSGGTVH